MTFLERHRRSWKATNKAAIRVRLVDYRSRSAGLAFLVLEWCSRLGDFDLKSSYLDYAAIAERIVEPLRQESRKTAVLAFAAC